jgi:hypothetical protein
MTRLFSSFAGICQAPQVMSGHIPAQRMRDDATAVASRLRVPSGGTPEVA